LQLVVSAFYLFTGDCFT